MVVIIDYGLGNLGSIKNMLNKIGIQSEISNDLEKINNAEKLILPGVGSFDNGMSSLNDLNLIEALTQKVIIEKTPILGICLGMQLMTKNSQEGTLPGLGWINAETKKFKTHTNTRKFPVPQMGWNYIDIKKNTPICTDFFSESKFYFVHAYYVETYNPDDVLFQSQYGENYTSGFEYKNIIGVQFHPEKSHKYGMKLLRNFINNY
jgi:glutamine amidotransferase